MNVKLAPLVGLMFFCTFTLSAMVIHNDSNKEKGGIRSEHGIFNEDYLFMGRDLQFSGQVEDLVFLGKKLTFSGKADLGVFALSQYVDFSGRADNGIMAACMDLNITGKIKGNNYIACRLLKIGETAALQGDLFAACAEIEINGILNGNLYAATHEIVINNEIQGNVTVYAQRIIIGEKGRIIGNLTHCAQRELTKKERARVTGKITLDKKHQAGKSRASSSRATAYLIGMALILSYVITGILLLFLPVFRKINGTQSQWFFWQTALWGLIPLLMYPAIIILCFILVVTIPLGFILMLAFFPLMYLAGIIGMVLLGKYLASKFSWRLQKLHYQFLTGALVVAILSLIPLINILTIIFVTALGWGVYVSFLFNKEGTALR
ncbi:MAG TPA: polymer-forming cytoskeletal protein [Chitinispirillaceae bacterium]|nr:polymer-forming cytoskeletal protein [Chitinispirillaceae bacterium]